MSIKNFLRNNETVYGEVLHIRRLRTIIHVKKLKRMSEQERRDYLADVYQGRIGHPLNWNKLETYTEKMQWEKLYDKNPLKAKLADKYLVREWVSEIIGDEYLIPIIGAWDSFKEIPFESLPDQFVVKTNHGTGTNIIVKDKNKCNWKLVGETINDWMKTDFAFTTFFEMHYSDIKRKIIIEQYMETELGELQDYKFLCFNGTPKFCWVDLQRYSKHTRNIYDLSWNLQPWTQGMVPNSIKQIPKPKNFEKMIEVATILCQGFHHVRVDLYNVNGIIYFGELTFTNGSGLDRIEPSSYDKMLGDFWQLPHIELQ